MQHTDKQKNLNKFLEREESKDNQTLYTTKSHAKVCIEKQYQLRYSSRISLIFNILMSK